MLPIAPRATGGPSRYPPTSSVPGAGAFTALTLAQRPRERPRQALGRTLVEAWRPGSVPRTVPREPGWEIRLCGRVAVSDAAGPARALPGRQGQLLLAYLVCHRTRACPRYELEDVLWPKDAPAASDSALSSLLSKLRRVLGPGALTGRAE